MDAPRHMRHYVCGQSTWRKTMQKAANLFLDSRETVRNVAEWIVEYVYTRRSVCHFVLPSLCCFHPARHGKRRQLCHCRLLC